MRTARKGEYIGTRQKRRICTTAHASCANSRSTKNQMNAALVCFAPFLYANAGGCLTSDKARCVMKNDNACNRSLSNLPKLLHLRFNTKVMLTALLGFCCLSDSVSAQDSFRIVDRVPIWRPVPRCPRCWPRPPIIDVPQIKPEEQAIEIGSYSVDAKVDGMFARVITEFTVHNKNGRAFEGELEFPLPDGATISGYAIDIDGAMVDARVVEKEKARIAFEAEVKKGTDPGIVEQIRGNAYRTRIYPIPAHGKRQIRVEYVTPLMLGTNGEAALALPMPRTELSTRDVKISVNIPGIDTPLISGLGDDRFKAAKAYWVVESHETNIKPGDDILVAMPALPQTLAVIESSESANHFMASIQLPQQATTDTQNLSSLRIIWDASGSRKPDDIAAARKILEALPLHASFELHVFRNVLEPKKTFKNLNDLIAYIDTIVYDGGTSFEPLNKIASQKFNGTTLFFTDGIDTYTNALPQFGNRSVALVSGAQHDTPAMRHICGGRVLDIAILPPDDVIRQITNPAPVVSAVTGNVSDVQGIGLPAIGRVTVTGRYKGSPGKIQIALSNGNKFDVDLSKASKSTDKTISSAWAVSRVEELSPNAEDHREELLALGRHFSIVSPVSSMIVFERLDQWIEYDIEPPETLAEMHKKWLAQHKSPEELKEKEKRNQAEWLEDLKDNWESRVTWWSFKPVKLKLTKKKECYDGECDIYYVDQFGNEYEVDEHGNVDLTEIDWSTFDAADVANMRYGSTGARGGGASLGGFGAGGFGPGGGGRIVAVQAARRPAAKAAMLVESESASSGGLLAQKSEMNSMLVVREESAQYAGIHGDGTSRSADASIVIQEWDPNTPYLTAILDAEKVYKDKDILYQTYIKQRAKYSDSPAFYLDCASLFFKKNQTELGLRILSNLAELKIDDVALLRVYAWRLREAGEYDHAVLILRKVLKLRPDEAVSWRDLALTLTMRAKKTKSAEDVQEALDCYYKAAFTYRSRSDAMATAIVALEEFNALVAWSKRQKLSGKPLNIPKIDSILSKNLDTDLRIVMMWDTDNSDIDLHVVEPSGEEVSYQNTLSRNRGMISLDITDGYGPEEYMIKKAPKGTYKAQTQYYASHEQKLLGPATVTAIVYTNWGRASEKSSIKSIRLTSEKETITIGDVEIK